MWQRLLLLSILVYCGSARRHDYEKYLSRNEDIVTVESLRRDVREPAPLRVATEAEDLLNGGNSANKKRDAKKHMKNASGKSDEGGYYKTYGSDAEGEKGYMKATYRKGDHGYKTLDTFHKRDGDNYGFEKHIAYGKSHGDKKSGHHGNSGSYSQNDGDHHGADTIVDTHYADSEGDRHDGAGEYSRYTEDADTDRHADDYNGHYTDKGPESSSYGHSESYSSGNGDDGSYETHSSYSTSIGEDDGEDKDH